MHLLTHEVDIDQMIIISDANGNVPIFDDHGKLSGLAVAGFEPTLLVLKELVQQESLPLEKALRPLYL